MAGIQKRRRGEEENRKEINRKQLQSRDFLSFQQSSYAAKYCSITHYGWRRLTGSCTSVSNPRLPRTIRWVTLSLPLDCPTTHPSSVDALIIVVSFLFSFSVSCSDRSHSSLGVMRGIYLLNPAAVFRKFRQRHLALAAGTGFVRDI